MNLGVSIKEIKRILEVDRNWSAYALADLDPQYNELCTWLTAKESVILIYHGLTPPVLFAMGKPDELEDLFFQIPPGKYTYTLMGYCRVIIRPRLDIEIEHHMWRMVLNPEEFPGTGYEGVVKLGLADLEAIQRLVSNQPDQPDAFVPAQLQMGPFFGLYEGDDLVSMAGIHIQSRWASVAAIGNVYTRPDRRGQHFATKTTAAVVADLLLQGIKTVVLNVGMDNRPALACYRKLGFWPYCEYYEGTGSIT